MTPSPRLLVRAAVLAGLPLALLSLAHGRPPADDDPLPLRLVPVRPEQLADEMKRVRQGLLVQLPRREFEDKLRCAAQVGRTLKDPPRLAEALYRAELTDAGLVGTGHWTVFNPHPLPGVLPLQPFGLALRRAPLAGGDEALVADFDGKSPGLLVEGPGEQSVTLDWSARGETRPDGLHFDLEVPPCPVAALELNLPRDHAVTVTSDGCLLSGPHEAEADDRRLWRINFSRRSQVHLSVRRAEGPEAPRPLVLARLRATQDLTPGFVLADFDFDLRVLHGRVRELRFRGSPGLVPYDVQAPDLESWGPEEPPAAAGLARLARAALPPTYVVRLREPFQGGAVRVRGHAPLPTPSPAAAPEAWVSPGVRFLGAAGAGETLVLRVHPDVGLENFQPGPFRLTRSATDDEGRQVLTLAGGGLEAAGGRHRPAARVLPSGAEYRARQLAWWQVGADQATLLAQITYEVSRGRLSQLPLAVPADWTVERVEASPAAQLAGLGVRTEGGRPQLLVDLRHPLGVDPRDKNVARPDDAVPAGAALRLTVWLRRPAPPARPKVGVVFPFPELVPLGARWHEGGLAVEFDENAFQVQADTKAAPRAAPDEDGPWGTQLPDYYYPYKGEPPRGTVALQPRLPRLRAACASEVFVTPGRVTVRARLVVRPEAGSRDTLDLVVAGPVAGRWEAGDWKVEDGRNQVRRFEQAPEAGGRGPGAVARWVAAAAGVAAGGPLFLDWPLAADHGQLTAAQHWRLTLARPLDPQRPLTLTCELQGVTRDGRCDVPLLAVAGAARMSGEVRLHLAGADPVRVEADGLREQPGAPGPRPGGAAPWRAFRYGAAPATLTLRGLAPAADRAADAGADHVVWTTFVEPSGRLLHHYRFRLWARRPDPVTLRLPAGAALVEAKIDGRWLDRPPAPTPEGEVALPVPAGAAVHDYEIAYATDGPAWRLWQDVRTPAPSLSLRGAAVPVLGFRRTWWLPPGVLPLHDGRYQPLPGPGAARAPRYALPDDLPAPAFVFQPRYLEAWAFEQPDLLEEAGRAAFARGPAGRPATLGEALDRLAFDYLRKERTPLVLDARALREAGLRPETPLPADAGDAPFWEAAGLAHVPCPAAPLLTTRRQLEAWGGGPAPDLAAALGPAVAEAAAHGHDRSGRFQSAADWLRDGGAGEDDAPAAPPPGAALPAGFGPDWAEWEEVAGDAEPERLLAVRRDGVPPAGLALALALAAGFGLVCRAGRTGSPSPRARAARRWRVPFLLLWLAGAGLALLWLPLALRGLGWWALLAGGAAAAGWYLWSAVRSLARGPWAGAPAPAEKPSGLAPAAVLGLALLWPAAYALLAGARGGAGAGPEPVPTVFVVPGPPEAPGRESVLAPPDVLRQLDGLARRGPGEEAGAVLRGARYEGKVIDGAAVFRATYDVYCFRDEAATLTVPLGGVQLEDDVLLDGAPAYPVALRAPQVGYALPVKGRGPHAVTLSFRVPVQAAGDERSLQFAAPGLPFSRLTLEAPAGARYLRARAGAGPVRGAQRARDEAGLHLLGRLLAGGPGPAPVLAGVLARPAEPARLEADLGRLTAPLLVRWRQEAYPVPAPAVEARELYLWDLKIESSTLTAVLHYKVTRGAVAALALDLPPGFEVQAVEAGSPADRAPLRVKDWRLADHGGHRRLEVEFPAPVAGEVRLTVQLASPRPLGGPAELLLPAPVGVNSTEQYWAYALDGLEARNVQPRQGGAVDPKKFAQLWKAAGRVGPDDPWEPARAYGPRKRPGVQAVLALQPQPRPAAVRGEQALDWRVGPREAEFRAEVKLAGEKGAPLLVEWDVPAAVQVARVTGRDVRSWSRAAGGTRLQVWLERPAGATVVRLEGWQPLPADAAQFALPWLRLVTAAEQATTVRLSTAGGVTLDPPRHDPNLRRLPAGGADWAFETDRPTAQATFPLRRAARQVEVRSLTFVEVADGRLTFTATLDCQGRQGELRALTVRLRDWDAAEPVQLTADRLAREPRPRRDPAGRTWLVELAPGGPGGHRLTLTGSLPLEKAAAGVPLPQVSVDEADPARSPRWLAVVTQDLLVEDVQGLQEVKITDLPAAWPREADRLRKAGGSAWRARDDGAGLLLLPRHRARGGAVRVFLTEHAAELVDGRRWAHDATYWLYHEANTDLDLRLPDGARVLAAAVDGREAAPLQPEPGRLRLPLPGGAGTARVRLCWRFDEGEAPGRPRSDHPAPEGAADGPAVWTVHVPPGYRLPPAAPGGEPRPASAAGLELCRARAQLQLSARLAPHVPGGEAPFADAQKRFFQACRRAEYLLAVADAPAPDAGPEGQSLPDWLEELKKQNAELASRSPALKELQKQAEAHADDRRPRDAEAEEGPRSAGSLRLAGLPERGTPAYWRGGADTPRPALESLAALRTRRALAASLLWLVVLAAVGLVARLPRPRAWVMTFWPEQAALLGWLVWRQYGLSLAALVLVVLGVVARLVYLGLKGRALLERPAPAAGSGSTPPAAGGGR